MAEIRPPKGGPSDPASPEEKREDLGPPKKESDPLFQPIGLKRRTTVIGLAPAPHLSARARERQARQNQTPAYIPPARAGMTGPPPPPAGGPPPHPAQQPTPAEVIEEQLPPPAFGQTTMLMSPQTPNIPLTLPQQQQQQQQQRQSQPPPGRQSQPPPPSSFKHPQPHHAGSPLGKPRSPSAPALPPSSGWEVAGVVEPLPADPLRHESSPGLVDSSPTILVDTPGVVRGFGGRVTPRGFNAPDAKARPARSSSGPPPPDEPAPTTERQPQIANANAKSGAAPIIEGTVLIPPQQQAQAQHQVHQAQQAQQQRSVSPNTSPMLGNRTQQQQQQQPPGPTHHQQPQPQRQRSEPQWEARPVAEPPEAIGEIIKPTTALARVPSNQEWQQQQQRPGARPPWKPRFPTVVGVEPPSGMANKAQVEGFRELRTRLNAIATGIQRNPFTTLIVPLTNKSGGSFVARNLATAFSTFDSQRAAILVDCNMDNPTQHIALRAPADVGLFDFLEDPQKQHIDNLVRPTSIPRLHLIPAGRVRSRFAEHFSSATMRALVDTIQQDSFVFLDGPPAQGSPDARILSQLVDFVILVVGYGKSTGADIEQAAAMFEPNKFAGVVFNERG